MPPNVVQPCKVDLWEEELLQLQEQQPQNNVADEQQGQQNPEGYSPLSLIALNITCYIFGSNVLVRDNAAFQKLSLNRMTGLLRKIEDEHEQQCYRVTQDYKKGILDLLLEHVDEENRSTDPRVRYQRQRLLQLRLQIGRGCHDIQDGRKVSHRGKQLQLLQLWRHVLREHEHMWHSLEYSLQIAWKITQRGMMQSWLYFLEFQGTLWRHRQEEFMLIWQTMLQAHRSYRESAVIDDQELEALLAQEKDIVLDTLLQAQHNNLQAVEQTLNDQLKDLQRILIWHIYSSFQCFEKHLQLFQEEKKLLEGKCDSPWQREKDYPQPSEHQKDEGSRELWREMYIKMKNVHSFLPRCFEDAMKWFAIDFDNVCERLRGQISSFTEFMQESSLAFRMQ